MNTYAGCSHCKIVAESPHCKTAHFAVAIDSRFWSLNPEDAADWLLLWSGCSGQWGVGSENRLHPRLCCSSHKIHACSSQMGSWTVFPSINDSLQRNLARANNSPPNTKFPCIFFFYVEFPKFSWHVGEVNICEKEGDHVVRLWGELLYKLHTEPAGKSVCLFHQNLTTNLPRKARLRHLTFVIWSLVYDIQLMQRLSVSDVFKPKSVSWKIWS